MLHVRSKNVLNFIADDCLHNNTFNLDIQSTLLGIIHELLARRMFELLAPTVNIWAVDVLDAVISELGDKKVRNILGPVVLTTSFPGSSLYLQRKDPGCGWSRDLLDFSRFQRNDLREGWER